MALESRLFRRPSPRSNSAVNKLSILLLAALPLSGSLACRGVEVRNEVREVASVRLRVFGLMCKENCGARATAAIERVNGAKVVDIGDIDAPTRSAAFRIEGSADSQAMLSALEEAGYGAKVE